MTPSEFAQQLDTAGLHPPGTLTLAITGACNLACCHCWVKAGETTSAAHLQQETAIRLAEEFAGLGGKGIRITGGEPLCNPGWLNILHRICSLGFTTVTLQTNAMLFTTAHLASLRRLDFPGLTIQISLDGTTPRTHDLVRGHGAFSGVLQGIELLASAGLGKRISLFFTEMRHNLHEIPRLLEVADSMGIGSVSSGAMVMCGRASETSLIAPPGVEQYLALLERYDRDPHFRELYARMGTVAALEWRKGEAMRQECCTFIENPYLTPSGRLYPCLMCHTDDYSVTGVFEKGLTTAFIEGVPLWSSLHRISRCRADEIPGCRECPVQPFCAGGCLGRAWGSCGNIMAPDDRCTTRQAVHRYSGTFRQ